jgi:uncharacterized protein (TIGR03086 family)
MAELDRRAVEASARVVSQAGPGDLDRATPCAGWTLRDLLEHMIIQHYGFAAASRGAGADPASWRRQPSPGDPVAGYADAAAHVIAAFAAPGAGERSFALPEISTKILFPAATAMSFHFVDYVVHGWDVARTLDVPLDLPDDLARAALAVARRVPDGPERLAPGAAFAPGVAAPDGAAPLDRVLTLLGRSPAWPA